MVKSCDEKSSGNSGCRFKGIRKRKWGRWVSEIRLPNSRERIWLGSYDAPEKAARAFDAAVFCLRGPDAKFNFPENLPVIDAPSSLTPVEIQEIAAKYANGDSAVVANPPQEQEQAQSLSESSPSSPPSLVSNDNLSTHLDSTLDFSFVDMLTADSGDIKVDGGIPRLYSDQFFTGFDLPAADFGEEFGFPQESFLWSF